MTKLIRNTEHLYSPCFIIQIDSIKWYKDGREFYRLHPGVSSGYIRQFEVSSEARDSPDITLVSDQVEGVTVDTNTSQLVSLGGDRGSQWQHALNILDTRLATSGQYRRVMIR